MALALPALVALILVPLGAVVGFAGYRIYHRTIWVMGALTGVGTWIVFVYASPLIENMLVQGVLLLLSIGVWVRLARVLHDAVVAFWGAGTAILLTYILLGLPLTDPFNPTAILIGVIAGFMAVKLHGLAVAGITAFLGGLGAAAGALQLALGGIPVGLLMVAALPLAALGFVIQARWYHRTTGRSIWSAAHPFS